MCRKLLLPLLTIAVFMASGASLALADDAESPLRRPEFYEGMRAAGTGGSHTAIASGSDALYHNPAGVARAPMYVLDGAFSYTPQGSIIGAGIADSKINPQIAGGAAYNFYFGQGDNKDLSGHDARLALAIPVVPERVSVGIGLRYLHIIDKSLPKIEDEKNSQAFLTGFTGDVGVTVRAHEMLHLGIAGQNLLDHCRDDDACKGATPTRINLGLGVGQETGFMASGRVALDLTSAPTPLFDFGVGVEYLAAQMIPIRLGFERRAFLDRSLITAGGGWRSEQAGVDFAYRHDLTKPDHFGYLSAGFSVYF